jgi:hypothetical protein
LNLDSALTETAFFKPRMDTIEPNAAKPQPQALGVRRLVGALGRRLVAVERTEVRRSFEPLNAALPGRQAG